ncbi:hypothetical protein ESCO_001067 [Escovopsis weberi]|uniref:RGS domain-containing protein n=1 Tax=Escovopsis weberi TaxID=150374 RepID=A0A0M9VU63_ESCWE|nr:hypothetical protein ESCO_001067 [Escovopsis weberi]
MASRPPSLTEILLDVAPPPWNRTAFMAYLSHNHCMESLEFTLESQRYAAFYDQHASDDTPDVCALWQRLIEVYIAPCATREVNIPARVRDYLISIPCGPTPPHPSELAEAARILFELMNDSLLLPFLQSVGPMHPDSATTTTTTSDSTLRPPPLRTPRYSSRCGTANHNVDFEGLTDDSGSASPASMEPMTPPTTPPTSEWSFNGSPGGFQRAVAAHNKGWKKVGEKLGFSRKSSTPRPIPTSSGHDAVDNNYYSTHCI